ncbi:MAG TPA: translation elongation factor Ts [Candidatus Paceibacterota bacterium]|nr:translation elongation factor Ts [Candidatus Paceibacterota bacterium]
MTDDVKKLRDMTGAGVMDCQRALEEAKGNFETALKLIKERGVLIAERKGERKTGVGIIESYVHNGRIGVLLEMRTETDFVARSEPFRELAHELAMQISAMAPADVQTLLKQPYIKDEATTVEDIVKRTIAKVGENIKVERFTRYEI